MENRRSLCFRMSAEPSRCRLYSGFQMSASYGEMRPRPSTAVASMQSNPAPPTARLLRAPQAVFTVS